MSDLQKGLALHQQGNNSEAKEVYASSLKENPKDFNALNLLGVIALQEGKIRLLLPKKILLIHDKTYPAFNEFKRAVVMFKKTNETREAKMIAFDKVENVKTELESALRDFLRTEKLLK